MRATRDARIVESEGQVTVTTYNLRPMLSRSLFLLGLIPWIVIAIFGLMSVGGLVSPETLTRGIRMFLVIFVILWIGGGGFLQWTSFLRAFSLVEIVANQDGVKIERRFPFGSTTRRYRWNMIEFISHYLTTGRPYGGVVMRAGQWLTTVDSRLPKDTAENVTEALLSVAPE